MKYVLSTIITFPLFCILCTYVKCILYAYYTFAHFVKLHKCTYTYFIIGNYA